MRRDDSRPADAFDRWFEPVKSRLSRSTGSEPVGLTEAYENRIHVSDDLHAATGPIAGAEEMETIKTTESIQSECDVRPYACPNQTF